MPLMLNSEPVAVTAVTFSLTLLEFVIATVCFAVVPRLTLLNAIVVGLTEIAAVPVLLLGDCVGDPVRAAQPERTTTA